MKRRYIALFFLALLIVPVLALPASALIISDTTTLLDLDDYLVSTEVNGSSQIKKYSFSPTCGYGLHSTTTDVFVSGLSYSWTNSSSSVYACGFSVPLCDPPSSYDSGWTSLPGDEVFYIADIPDGSIITLDMGYSFKSSYAYNLQFTVPIHFYLSDGTSVRADSYSCSESSTGISSTSTIGTFSFSALANTTYSGIASVSCVVPEDAVYMLLVPEMRYYLNKSGNYTANFQFTSFDLTIEGSRPAVTPSFSYSWDPDFTYSYNTGQSATTLDVEVVEEIYGSYSYQWYCSQDGGAWTAVAGATSYSFKPSTDTEGTFRYRCNVTHVSGSSSASATSPVAVLEVTAVPPVEPEVSMDNDTKYTYVMGSDTAISLGVTASASDGGTISYQWYISTDQENWYICEGATDSELVLDSTIEPGTYYFRCEIINSNAYSSTSVFSETTTLTVRAPTIDDVTTSWGSTSVLEVNQGDKTSLYINVPSGLYDSYTLQWYVLSSSFSSTAIDGETAMGFQIPTDELGTFQYMVLLTGQDGTNLVRTQFKTPKILVMEEGSVVSSVDEFTGISWNWDDNPVRIKQGSSKILLVSIPSTLSGWSIQWYSGPEYGPPAPIAGATDCFYEVPTDALGETYYTCVVTLEDGTTVSPTAQVIVVEADNYDSTTGGTGSGTGSSRPTGIDTSGWYKTSTKNNLDLVEWAKQAYENGWGYVLGTYGQILTEDLLEYKIEQYPDISRHEEFIRNYWLNGRVADCVGLIKGYCWFTPSDGSIGYAINDTPDYSADQMYEWCEEIGTIDTLPEIPGLLLWKSGHVGIYIGGGYVIEARGTKAGVIKSYIGDLAWTNWAKIPSIDYLETGAAADDNSLSGIWQSIKNLPQAILDGIKGLFVPNAEAMAAYSDKWEALLAKRFGAIYESVSLVSDFASSIKAADAQNTITMPKLQLDFSGVPFVFGGYEVRIVPEGFEFIVEPLKKIISIIATLAFVNAMRSKFEHILGGGGS